MGKRSGHAEMERQRYLYLYLGQVISRLEDALEIEDADERDAKIKAIVSHLRADRAGIELALMK